MILRLWVFLQYAVISSVRWYLDDNILLNNCRRSDFILIAYYSTSAEEVAKLL